MIRRQTLRSAKRLVRLSRVNGSLDAERVHEIVQRIVAARRRDWMPTLVAFQRQVRLDRAAHHAAVESGAPLPPDVQIDVERRLSQRYGPGLVTSFTTNPDLIAGIRVRVASDLYDGSLRGRLARLEAAI
jgi:F-type H+-transporting ATPase subunit delta